MPKAPVCSRCGKQSAKTHFENNDKSRVLFKVSRIIEMRLPTYFGRISNECFLCEDCQQSLLKWFISGKMKDDVWCCRVSSEIGKIQ